MKHLEQSDEAQIDETNSFGLSTDDLSMLNQVLQQVKGSSCVSCASTSAFEYEVIEAE